MKIIERYVTRELLIPFMVVILVLTGLFVSFSSARFLDGGITATLGLGAMVKLVWLKTLIALEVLVPIALYIAVIIGLGRLSRDQEMNVLRSSGISNGRIIVIVLMVAIPVGILSGILSIYARPWAYAESYLLDAQAEAELNTNRLQAGRFYGDDKSGRVVYVRSKDGTEKQMQNMFHYIRKDGGSEIVIAKEAHQLKLTSQLRPQIELFDGYLYHVSDAVTKDSYIKFEKLTYFIDNDNVVNFRRKSATTQELWHSDQPREVAELQWRLSRPVATILLALIAVSFTRTSPRQDKGDKTYFVAALVFAIYYNLSGLAQTWVEQGVVATMPGIWWLYLIISIIVALSLSESVQRKVLRQ